MKRVLFAILLGLVLAGPAIADEATNLPIQFTFTGYIGDPPAGVTPLWKWSAGYKGKTYALNVVKTELLSDSVMPQDIDEWVTPYKPSFNLAGDDKALTAFTTSKAGQKVAVSGHIRYQSTDRLMELDTVTPAK